MSEPVNLNKFRKAKARAEKEQRAKENRARFGRSKAEKAADRLRQETDAKTSDAHRLNRPPEQDG